MCQIPVLTTVVQNLRTWEWEFSDPYVVWFAPPLSTSEFRAAFFTVYKVSIRVSCQVLEYRNHEGWIARSEVPMSSLSQPSLTLIRAAGGVYYLQNFEQVKLHNALSNKIFFKWMNSLKNRLEYILLSNFN